MRQVEIAAQIAVGVTDTLNGRVKTWIAADTSGNAYIMAVAENPSACAAEFLTAEQAEGLAEQLRLAAEKMRAGGNIKVALPPPIPAG